MFNNDAPNTFTEAWRHAFEFLPNIKPNDLLGINDLKSALNLPLGNLFRQSLEFGLDLGLIEDIKDVAPTQYRVTNSWILLRNNLAKRQNNAK